MGEETPRDDELEQSLQSYYASQYGRPPAPSAIWSRVARQQTEDVSPVLKTKRSDTDERAHREPVSDLRPQSPHAGIGIDGASSWRTRAIPALAAAAVVAVLAALLVGPLRPHGVLPTPSAQGTDTTAVPQAHLLLPSEVLAGAQLTDVQMLSPNDGWAVGGNQAADGCSNSEGGTCQSLILHYTGSRWSETGTALPNVWLDTLSMVSSSEGWAGGSQVNPSDASITPILLHYAQGRWSELAVQAMGSGEVVKIQMLSADEGWAIVGGHAASSGSGPFVLWHYAAGNWSLANAPGSDIFTLSMVSAEEGWAAGTREILHYQNGHWTPWKQQAPGVATAIQMVSPTDGWMGGVAPDGGGTNAPHHLFMLHYDGASWQPVQLPAVAEESQTGPIVSDIASISMSSASEGWAVGNIGSANSLILHYTGAAWHLETFAVSEPLYSVSMPSSSQGWAVGAQRDLSNFKPAGVLLHFSGDAWSIYKP